MPEATWQRFVASRPKPPDYVRGTYSTPGSGRTMEQNAAAMGGTLTGTPSATTSIPPAASASKPAAPATERYKPVTKLGVHQTHTPTQPAVRLSTSTAADRLVSSHSATGGSRTTLRSGFTAPAKAVSAAPGTTALDRMTGVTSSGAGNAGIKSNTRLGAVANDAAKLHHASSATKPGHISPTEVRRDSFA
jgi:hypothetical protein